MALIDSLTHLWELITGLPYHCLSDKEVYDRNRIFFDNQSPFKRAMGEIQQLDQAYLQSLKMKEEKINRNILELKKMLDTGLHEKTDEAYADYYTEIINRGLQGFKDIEGIQTQSPLSLVPDSTKYHIDLILEKAFFESDKLLSARDRAGRPLLIFKSFIRSRKQEAESYKKDLKITTKK